MARAPFIPDDAPFDAEQRAWLNGFFAGWASRSGRGGAMPAPGLGEAMRGPTDEAGRGSTGNGQGPGLPTHQGDGQALPEPVVGTAREPAYTRTRPFPARLITNLRLSLDGSAKDVRHLEIDVSDSVLTYDVGDALGVLPQNCGDYVDALITALEWSGDEPVRIDGESLPLREVLRSRRTITQPPKPLLEAFAERGAEALRPLLNDRKALDSFLWGHDVLDLVGAYPSVRLEPQAFVELLRPLQHRLYSISSSPKAHPDEVHLTVGAVRYEFRGRARKGVCSTFLADRCTSDAPLPVFVHPNKSFRLPADDSAPVIMVGPGTGVAPFRAFLEERRATGAAGKNWLFFGDQHAATDFLYRDELQSFLDDGTLDRLDLAWSRDGDEKVYVQHRMLEHAGLLFDWLEEGASFYVCGDADRMAKDVDAALHRIIRTEGGLTEDAAADYVKQLKRDKRYVRDVY